MKWIRLYCSVLDSVKVRTLPEPAQLDFFLLLCCAGEYRARTGADTGETGLSIADATWRMRRGTLGGTFPALSHVGLAHLDDHQMIVLDDWNKYQFVSDDTTRRTRKSKGKKPKHVPGNVPGNGLDTDTDTDTDTEKGQGQGLLPPADAGAPAPPAVVAPRRKAASRKAVGQSPPTNATWDAYAAAYLERYGAEPPRGPQVNGALANLLRNIPAEELPAVAVWYVHSNDPHVAREKHPITLLARSWQRWHTEWKTKGRQTSTLSVVGQRTAENLRRWLENGEEKHGTE